jgi:hypothetical protein
VGPLDTWFDRLEKYIAEALEPIIKFRKFRIFEHIAFQEFYSVLRSAMIGTRWINLLRKRINDQTQ